MDRVAILENADDASGLTGLVLDLDDRFMQGGIERRSKRVDLSYAKPIERREEQMLRCAHAIEKPGLQGHLFRPIPRRGDRALQVVDDCQELGGEVRDRVLPCVRRAALGPASGILGVRHRPQQAIAQGGVLSRERD